MKKLKEYWYRIIGGIVYKISYYRSYRQGKRFAKILLKMELDDDSVDIIVGIIMEDAKIKNKDYMNSLQEWETSTFGHTVYAEKYSLKGDSE